MELTGKTIQELKALLERVKVSDADYDVKTQAIRDIEFELKIRGGAVVKSAMVVSSEVKFGEV